MTERWCDGSGRWRQRDSQQVSARAREGAQELSGEVRGALG
jgi:hypothetical protein